MFYIFGFILSICQLCDVVSRHKITEPLHQTRAINKPKAADQV